MSQTTIETPDTVVVDVIREYQIYDMLPAWIRKILQDAPKDIHVEGVARFYVMMKKRNLSQQYMAFEISRRCNAS